MLFALLDGKRVRASHDLERGQDYTCPIPSCDHPELILKKGEKKAPHFAHKTKSNCVDLHESETDAHIAMKDTFQNTLGVGDESVENPDVEGVVPDVLWDDEHAIELQHSSITPEKVQERNEIYKKNDLNPVWVLHEDEEGDNVFDEGKFGKRYKGNDSLSQFGDDFYKVPEGKGNIENPVIYILNEVEKLLVDILGGLFYMKFPKKAIGKGKEDILKDGSKLSFSDENGPSLTFNELKKIVQENDLFHRTSQTPIKDASDLKKVLDSIKERKKPTSEELLERRKEQQDEEFERRYGEQVSRLNDFKRELEEKFEDRKRELESEYDNKTRKKFLEFSEKGLQEALKAKDALIQVLKEKLDMAKGLTKGIAQGIGRPQGWSEDYDAGSKEPFGGCGSTKNVEGVGSPGTPGIKNLEGKGEPQETTGTQKPRETGEREVPGGGSIPRDENELDELIAKIIAFFKDYEKGADPEKDETMRVLHEMFD
ncbi:MAG: competence protein CoiA family protein [Candidatus Hodarchaeota archaeon]